MSPHDPILSHSIIPLDQPWFFQGKSEEELLLPPLKREMKRRNGTDARHNRFQTSGGGEAAEAAKTDTNHQLEDLFLKCERPTRARVPAAAFSQTCPHALLLRSAGARGTTFSGSAARSCHTPASLTEQLRRWRPGLASARVAVVYDA